jgi:hypothetical protein
VSFALVARVIGIRSLPCGHPVSGFAVALATELAKWLLSRARNSGLLAALPPNNSVGEPPMSDRELFRNVALNFLMGATLGALLVALLLALNVQNIAQMVLHDTTPVAVTVILLIGASVYFALGAAITGFHFVIMDENNKSDSRR